MQARLIQEIGTRVYLRRYQSSTDPQDRCPGGIYPYHNASVLVDTTDEVAKGYLTVPDGQGAYAGDPRWPTRCDHCPYAFHEGDVYQVHVRRRFNTASGAPEAGDLFWSTWHGAPHLHGVLPSGDVWDMDGPSSRGGPGWTRHGEPPRVTASPSISAPGYHGYLRDGVWTPDLDGRTYPAGLVARGFA